MVREQNERSRSIGLGWVVIDHHDTSMEIGSIKSNGTETGQEMKSNENERIQKDHQSSQ